MVCHRREFLAALAALPQQKPKRQPRPPDLQIARIASTRQEGRIAYEGDLKVTGERPLNGLILQFEFFESRRVLLSMQKIEVESGTLMPGEERHFNVQGADVPRAVSFRLSGSETNGRELSVAGGGPHPLD